MILYNAHILAHSVEVERGYIEIKGGKISRIVKGFPNIVAGTDLDCEGAYIFPGFIDTHIHGGNGVDTMDADEKAFKLLCDYEYSHGVTTFFPTTVTASFKKTLNVVNMLKVLNGKDGFENIGGIHLEGPFLDIKRIGAQNPSFLRSLDEDELRKWFSLGIVRVITYAPVSDPRGSLPHLCREYGVKPSIGHSEATFEEFERCYALGVRHLTHFCNAMSGLHHRHVGLVGAGFLHNDVYLEVIADRCHLNDQMLRLIAKIKEPSRVILITDAIRASGMKDGEYELGGLKVSVLKGEARLKDGTLAGSTLTMEEGVKNYQIVTKLPLRTCLDAATYNPAEFYGIKNAGDIREGMEADLVVCDTQTFNVLKTIKEGKVVFDG
ncbi:MAG: N-acetylglucosamine-6-phosphate deacetylase [Thermotogae bacterium]|nr:N-acetylglucosamine-6-phosphate deacetylase [Thermotogota bacterium]